MNFHPAPSHIRSLLTLYLLFCIALVAGCSSTPKEEGVDAIAPEEDPGWPRAFSNKGQTVTIYQPQVDDWKDFHVIHYRAAIAFTPEGAMDPQYGVLSAEAQTA